MTATTPKNRRNRKAQDLAEATELKDILNQEPEKTVTEAAEYVSTTEAQLLEMFCERLSDGSVLAWHTVPTEHESLLDEFKNLIAPENSVRRLDAPSETTAELPPVVEPPILQDDFQQSAITEAPLPNDLTNGIAQDLQDTQQAVDETLELQDLLFAAEADDKAQLAAAVKKHGWQIYQRVGAEIDVATILEIAQSKLNAADGVTNSRLANLAERLGVKTPEQIRKEVAQRKEAFFAQQQQRQTAWKSATSSQT